MTIEHSDIIAGEIHEPKGVASATVGQVYIADGAGGGSWGSLASATLEQGIYDYNDAATASTPIPLSLAGTQYELTNDGLGPNTNKTYALSGITDMWNVGTDRFDFSGLNLGDTVDIRFDIEFTTGTNDTDIFLMIELGVGGSPYQLTLVGDAGKKSSGLHSVLEWNSIYMGDTNTLNNPARILASADKTGTTVKVNGWYIRPLRTGV